MLSSRNTMYTAVGESPLAQTAGWQKRLEDVEALIRNTHQRILDGNNEIARVTEEANQRRIASEVQALNVLIQTGKATAADRERANDILEEQQKRARDLLNPIELYGSRSVVEQKSPLEQYIESAERSDSIVTVIGLIETLNRAL